MLAAENSHFTFTLCRLTSLILCIYNTIIMYTDRIWAINDLFTYRDPELIFLIGPVAVYSGITHKQVLRGLLRITVNLLLYVIKFLLSEVKLYYKSLVLEGHFMPFTNKNVPMDTPDFKFQKYCFPYYWFFLEIVNTIMWICILKDMYNIFIHTYL